MKHIQFLLLFFSVSLFAQETETFSWDAATINDKLHLTIRKNEFDAIYKKADSIAAPQPRETCGTEEELAAKFLHYKGVTFELDNGILNFRKIDFSKKKAMSLLYKGTKFNENFTLEAYRKLFPQSAANLEETEGGLQLAILKPDENTNDFEWRFYFGKGKLVKAECWFPCD